MAEILPGLSYAAFVAEALRHPTEPSFRSSSFFARHGEALLRLLSTPRLEPAVRPAPPARAQASASERMPTHGGGSPLRAVHWNIEKGKGLAGLRHALTTHPYLSGAHVWCLNEVDIGMARAGPNADVARELAAALGCHSVYVPSYIECTKGTGTDLLAPGENELGLHGLAVLSRLPVMDMKVTLLPQCHDYFRFHEKRFGCRQGLYVKLDWDGRPLLVGTTHLEVRNTPRCRARQFGAFLRGLAQARREWGEDAPVLITGDWNTNTFRRGSVLNSMLEYLRIVRTEAGALDEELVRPFAREPLFALLRDAGLSVEGFNNTAPTASQLLGGVEDLKALPPPLAAALSRAAGLRNRVLWMRLDWIAAAGLAPVGTPRTLRDLTYEGLPVSDHAAIGVEVV